VSFAPSSGSFPPNLVECLVRFLLVFLLCLQPASISIGPRRQTTYFGFFSASSSKRIFRPIILLLVLTARRRSFPLSLLIMNQPLCLCEVFFLIFQSRPPFWLSFPLFSPSFQHQILSLALLLSFPNSLPRRYLSPYLPSLAMVADHFTCLLYVKQATPQSRRRCSVVP